MMQKETTNNTNIRQEDLKFNFTAIKKKIKNDLRVRAPLPQQTNKQKKIK